MPLNRTAGAFILALTTGTLSMAASASPITVSTFGACTDGVWCKSDMRAAGTADIVDLAGLGGDLELNQPLPTGAVRLTTGDDTGDKAEVGIFGAFGTVSDIFPTLEVGYSFYKEDVAGGSAFAAPSLKLSFFEENTTSPSGDGFVTLVYEPTWNQVGLEGSSATTPTGTWVTTALNLNTGLWWGTGGFSQPNTAGGPPLRTLAEWSASFDSAFQNAQLLGISVGVGTFNLNQVGYFDNVSISAAGQTTAWNFEQAGTGEVPAPSPLALVVIGLAALLSGRRMRSSWPSPRGMAA